MAARRVDPWAAAVVLSFTGVTAAWVGTEWALDSADGVVLLLDGDGSTYELELITRWLYWEAALVGVAAVVLASVYRWQAAAVGLAGVAAGLVWGAAVYVDRYRDSGSGDGLGVLVFLVPLLAVGVGAGLVAGAAVRQRR